MVLGDDGGELRWDPIEVHLLAGSELSGPPPDVVTGMEHPRAGDEVGPEELDVVGWAYVRDGAVSTVSVRLDGALLGRASLARPRPDVAAEVDDPRAVLSGVEFHHALDPVDRPTPALLEVSVCLLDGREVPWESVPVVRVPSNLRAAAEVPRPRSRRPTVRRPPSGAVRVLVSARGLDRGGSQLRMAELVGHLSRVGGFDVTVATGADGPLREDIEAAGATVQVVPDPPMDDVDGYERELASWRHWMEGRFDLVMGATITSFAAVDLAQRLGIPSVIRLGEAEPLRTVVRWIYGEFDPGVQDRAREALAGADAVVSISSRAIDNYRADGVDATFVLLRTGVDLGAATVYRESSDRDRCRRQLGIREDARLLVCAGALWPVKGQALLVAAAGPAPGPVRRPARRAPRRPRRRSGGGRVHLCPDDRDG